MYLAYFQLREMPFSITPDPAYLYLSPRHQEALGHLLYGTGQYGGFVQLTGEVGTGKTTVVRTLLEQKLDNVDVAVVLNPRQNELEFLQTICDELGIAYGSDATLKGLVDRLNVYLLDAHARGRRTVLIIDEAQNLSPDVLEQVRLLTNLETHKEKLLRIMLVGQPELAELLSRAELRQLSQRITARYHLEPLNVDEARQYLAHRLRVAGGDAMTFPPPVVAQIHRLTGGIPRLINVLCDRALLGAYASGTRQVTTEIVRGAAREALGAHVVAAHGPRGPHWSWIAAAAVLLIAVVGLIAAIVQRNAVPAPMAEVEQTPAIAESQAEPAAEVLSVVAPSTDIAPPAGDESAAVALIEQPMPLARLMDQLIARWGSDYSVPTGSNVCEALSQQGLECFKGQGGWADLGGLNRPAILTLRTPFGENLHTLLLSLGTDSAEVLSAEGSVRLTLSQLDLLWTGEYLMLWRRETSDSLIAPGSQGSSVQWLRSKLAQAEGRTLPSPLSPTFDPELREAVRRFQRQYGLKVDGLAGAETQIQLGHIGEDEPGPTLTPEAG
ncbi:AAA family ATPase [Algiphilus sp. W345]|uniref:AAA family ATPase n=1 Tax=Banduia mediterranea TaxID=3075609 RepID=A0ABU2WN80_9GAMM|nr:AAA family ATPase [Algiphilus sp. W345]MDT0498699.1 AAA family ATPase [Algiphilus sp. W345]